MRGAGAPTLSAATARAYARTDYTAEGGRIVAHVGRRGASVDAWLRLHGARQGAFVTAWNPYSRIMPRGWNDRMQERLRLAARRLGAPVAEGWGRARERIPRAGGFGPRRDPGGAEPGRWAERHLLIGADPRRVAVLGRRFRQAAILGVRAGAPARLVALVPSRAG